MPALCARSISRSKATAGLLSLRLTRSVRLQTCGSESPSRQIGVLWRDVDLANGRFEVGRDKTDAGAREVDMLPLLRDGLVEHKAASQKTGPADPVFTPSTGRPRPRHNLRQDVVEPVVAHATNLPEERGVQPLPLGITPHKLRHTVARPSTRSWKAEFCQGIARERIFRLPGCAQRLLLSDRKAPHLRGFSIGAPGFEPGTSPTRTVRATRLRHAPMKPSIPQAHGRLHEAPAAPFWGRVAPAGA